MVHTLKIRASTYEAQVLYDLLERESLTARGAKYSEAIGVLVAQIGSTLDVNGVPLPSTESRYQVEQRVDPESHLVTWVVVDTAVEHDMTEGFHSRREAMREARTVREDLEAEVGTT